MATGKHMKRVLVTGANRGIGLELVRQSLAVGDRVFAGCREPEKATDLLSLASTYSDRLTVLRLDVTDQATIDESRSVVQARVDGLDLLFNNAGVYVGEKSLKDVRPENLIFAVRVNAMGPILVAQRFIGLLKKGNSPKIVNISSESGSISTMQHFRGYSYFGSKAALNMYTRALAFDRETDGIVVIALHPGWVRTDMGGSEAPLTPAEAVGHILDLVQRLTADDNGKFLTGDGREYPW